MFACKMCGCQECNELGTLGSTLWVRCRDCHWESTLVIDDLEAAA